MKSDVSKANVQLQSSGICGELMPSDDKYFVGFEKSYDSVVIGEFKPLHDIKRVLRVPQEGIQEWWIPQNEASAGALKGSAKGANVLYGELNVMIEQIVIRQPERVILAHDGVNVQGCRRYIDFLGGIWKHRGTLNVSLEMYIPKGLRFSEIFGRDEKFEEENFRHILFDKSSSIELRPYTDYLNYESLIIPFFDLDRKNFDLVDFYDFCCRKWAYIIKMEQLFPRLDKGMTNYNFGEWKVASTFILLGVNPLTEYNSFYHGQSMRLWKLLEGNVLRKKMGWFPLDSFCRDKDYDCCWHYFFPKNYLGRIEKNRLSKVIWQKEGCGSDYDHEFLFPLVLFLGHYCKYEGIECCIPEYNFHELIHALILLIEGNEIPELLPDFPGEEYISLDAYRQGVIKLPPACTDYYYKDGQIIAEFKNADMAYGFIEQNRAQIDGEVCYADKYGRIVFKNVSNCDEVLEALNEAKTKYREYPINMWLWDGSILRKMTLQEILTDAAERILRHFVFDYREAVRFLEKLSAKFKNQYLRYSKVLGD